jgi:hypothetical protein
VNRIDERSGSVGIDDERRDDSGSAGVQQPADLGEVVC